MTHKHRMLMAARGEMPDMLPYVPRFDLWYNSNLYRNTLPEKYEGMTPDEIARSEGWGLHKVIPELLEAERPEENLYRCLGLYGLKENGCRIEFSDQVEIKVEKWTEDEEDLTRVVYHTPKGVITTTEVINEEMRRAGVSITWVKEHALKRVEDYETLAFLFEQVRVIPDYDRYAKWQAQVGDDGLACLSAAFAASPMQFIQRDFLNATDFFYHYRDNQTPMRRLVESVEQVFDQLLKVAGDSPAEVVLWGANFDDMITYPPYFEKEITPWLQKASSYLQDKGKLVICHTDGENQGLIDLIADTGMHIAEAVCPAPMTKVPVEVYYRKWCSTDKLCIFGGLPQSLLSPVTATEAEMHTYLDHFFKAVAPGKRIIAGVADTTPPDSDFNRLIIIGQRLAEEGRLPMEAGGFRPLSEAALAKTGAREKPVATAEEEFKVIRDAILAGDCEATKEHARSMLGRGIDAGDILQKGMIAAMDVISVQFKDGSVFIPEVLLSARAMNEGLLILKPHLASDAGMAAKILIGTVHGDLHDIGKNMVVTMLRSSGFEVIDLGINVKRQTFIEEIIKHKPDILGLSALLTTTMPEMGRVIESIVEKGIRDQLKIIVGGAPLNAKFAEDIRADGYGKDAGEAVELVKKLV
jgi:corrinoid protein of di/trimethylamine methyltransferase